MAEATRGAVQSIPREQHEAAAALGFGWLGRHRAVILPQALRRLLPPLVSLLVNIIQNSTLAQVIGGLETLEAGERQTERLAAVPPIGLGENHGFEIFAFVAADLLRDLVPADAARCVSRAQADRVTAVDSLGNELAPGLPYARGRLLAGTEDDHAKLRAAWRVIEGREAIFDFTGLERSLDLGDTPPALLDDELAPAVFGARLTELGLEHLGGEAGRDDVFVANRLTAAVVAAMQVLVRPGDTVVGVSAAYSHPCVLRAVALAGGTLVDTVGLDAFREALDARRRRRSSS